jgi:hypothetical protein
MKTLTLILAAATLAAMSGAGLSAEGVKCSIRDSAMCLAEPGCHYDVNRRGCYEGPLPGQDACAAHEDESICVTDVSLGCKWDAEKKKCASQPR